MKSFKRWFLIPTSLSWIAVAGLSGCAKHNQNPGNVPAPQAGLQSPFAKSKVVFSPSLGKVIAQASSTSASSLDLNSSQTVIPSGAGLTVILNDICMIKRHNDLAAGAGLPIHHFIDKYIHDSYYSQALGKFDESAIPITLKSRISIGDLHRMAQTDPCIVGVTNTEKYVISAATSSTTPISYNDPNYSTQQAYLSQINFPEADAFFAANVPSSVKVNVAVIDTGFDMNNEDKAPFNAILDGSDIYGDSSIPQDTDGHGTEVASLISAQGNNAKGIVGIASRNVNLLPIRLFEKAIDPKNSEIDAAQIFKAVKLAVNAGAEVVNMSFSTDARNLNDASNTMSCDILTGYAIYRAIEGGTFFTIAAGQWTQIQYDSNGNPIPIPGSVTPPKENAPLPVGLNAAPACWGRYYKGALTVGALQTGSQTLASFSNWGSDGVEIAAPGSGVETYSLNNQLVKADGTSLSSAEVAAAAALTIAYHKEKNWPYSPWLIEDILLNGSASSSSLQNPTDGRAVHDGKILDLNALAAHLQQLSSETQDQRLHEPSENPENGTKFIGGNGDPSTGILRQVQLYTDSPFIQSDGAERGQVQLVAYYSNASFEVITDMPGVAYTVSDSTKASVDSQGIVYPVPGSTGPIIVTASYAGQTASTTVTLTPFNILTGAQAQLSGLSFMGYTGGGLSMIKSVFPLSADGTIDNTCPAPFHTNADDYKIEAHTGALDLPSAPPASNYLDDHDYSVSPVFVAHYLDGTSRVLYNNLSSNPVSTIVTSMDGSALDTSDVGGSQFLATALYRGQKAQLKIKRAALPAVSASFDRSSDTITRGNLLTLSILIKTSGTCNLFKANMKDPSTGMAQIIPITDPTWVGSVTAGFGGFPQVHLSSPQPILNSILNGGATFSPKVTVGNQLPAGTYTINGTVTYRGGGNPQVLTISPFTFTLKDNLPVAVQIDNTAAISLNHFGTYPINTVMAKMKLADGTLVQSAPYNFNWTITGPGGEVISQNATDPNATVWADVTSVLCGGSVNCEVAPFIFSGNVGDTYTFTATETTTGLSATKQFTITTPQITHYSGPFATAVTPSLSGPTPSPSPAPASTYCNAAAMTAAPFAGGSGTQSDPYTICTPDQFLAIASNPDKVQYYVLKQNLDFSSMGNMAQKMIQAKGFVSLDGGGYEIQNFTAVDQEAPQLGLFGTLDYGAAISNLVIRNPSIQGVVSGALIGDWAGYWSTTSLGLSSSVSHVYVIGGTVTGNTPLGTLGGIGGLVGSVQFPVNFSHCYVLGTEVDSVYGGVIGGLIGRFNQGTISDSGAETSIRNIGPPGSMSGVGGLVGVDSEGTIATSYAKGMISGATNTAGGLVGDLGGIVVHSASSVEVVAQGTGVGGLVGNIYGGHGFDGIAVISDSLATGHVWGGQSNSGGSKAGGLVGTASLAIIENSQAMGNVAGVSYIGGLIGTDEGFNQIYNCSASGQVSATTGPVGGFGAAKTQMDGHNLNGLYHGDTWSEAGTGQNSAYGQYLNTSHFTPSGMAAK